MDQPSPFALLGRIRQEDVPDGFRMPVPIRFTFDDRPPIVRRVLVDAPEVSVELPLPARPADIEFNAGHAVLARVAVTSRPPPCRRNGRRPMNRHELLSRISIDPDICFGKPRFRGHRIWVSLVLDLLADGWTVDQLLDEYPGIEEGGRSGVHRLWRREVRC